MTSRTMRTGAVARTPPLGLTSHRADRGPVRRIFGHPATHCITDDSDTGPWSGRLNRRLDRVAGQTCWAKPTT